MKLKVLLTRADRPFKAHAVEVVTFTVLSPHLTKLICVAGALSAQTVPSPTAGWAVLLWYAIGIIRWTVVLN